VVAKSMASTIRFSKCQSGFTVYVRTIVAFSYISFTPSQNGVIVFISQGCCKHKII
jgi:hypothetical protein